MSFILKVAIVFLALFDLSFKAAPILSTGKIIVATLSMYYFFKNRNKLPLFKSEAYVFIFYFFILAHVVLVFLLNGMPETTTMARMIYYFIYSIWLSFIFGAIFKDKSEFVKVLSVAIFVQACFVIVSWLSSDYRIIIDQLLVQTGNISLLSAKRPPGLMNSAGAKASVILGIGSAFSLYQLTLSQKRKSLVLYTIIMLVNLAATFIVGRTGLLLFLILAISILIQRANKLILNRSFFVIITTAFALIVLVGILIPVEFTQNITYKVEWVLNEFSNGLFEAETVLIIREMSIKELGMDTLIGTSRIRLPDGQHDSGYIQNYHSMGLIFAVIFYITVMTHIASLLNMSRNSQFVKENKLFLIALILGLFIVEIKEPFILSYSYMLIILTLLKIPKYDRIKNL